MLPNSKSHAFFSNTSRLGLEQASSSSSTCKRQDRKTAAARSGLEWDAVTVTRDHPTTPQVKCNYCSHSFSGGAMHIRKHLLERCTCKTEAFCELKTGSSLQSKIRRMRQSGRRLLTEMAVDDALG